MCGIAGYYQLAAGAGDAPDLERMVAAIVHRGPDSDGFYRAPGVGLGVRRLRVIDLETGDQPIADESGDVRVVTNGEIYNFRELRRELEGLGHRFRTRSDTEVLVHGYEEWGVELPCRLRGMFAFALWDAPRRRLVLARDHLGIKPLFYAHFRGTLLFASEIKALLAGAPIARKVDPLALDQYLSYLYVPEPRTIFTAVETLPAGCVMVCEKGDAKVRRYYAFRPRRDRFASRAEAVERVRESFEDSVRAMMVSDVPIGLFLSGGVDSASILAMMARASSRPVRTFSIGFGERERRWDELTEARRLAERFASEHHEFRLEPDVVSQLPEVVRAFDQPFANPTAVILLLLAGEARRTVTVALSGTGGDELFAGYPRYLGMLLYHRYRWLPGPLRRAAAQAARKLVRDASDGRLAAARLRRFLEAGTLPFDESYARILAVLEEDRKRELYGPRLRSAVEGFDASAFLRRHLADDGDGERLPPLERLQEADVATYLPFNQLAYGDRMTMARSLELRVPFVDQRLAEDAAAVPLAWNLRRGVTKALFRDAMAAELPPEVVRGGKRGLNLPIALWLRGELEGWMRELLGRERLERRGYFRPAAVEGLIDEHVAGRRDHSLALWALLVFELWHQQYLDG